MMVLLQKHIVEIKNAFCGGDPLEVSPGKRNAGLLGDDKGRTRPRGRPRRINTGARGP
ncbi:MAG: hypothetical protein M1130_13030 [Actinobacteria bacterium]|nr:hypothetical protein [Actinomycetota bacterium]